MGKVKVNVVYYSMYMHVYTMAQAIKEGIDSVSGCEGVLYQVAETLPEEVLTKMHAPAKPDVPIASPETLVEADGVMFGIPTRFGMMAAQMKAFFDSTGSLWQQGKLIGKPAGVFFSTGTQGAGQETTALTTVTQLAHHGMVFVPMGYIDPDLLDDSQVRGGGPYGAGCLAGADGSRQPSEQELKLAKVQGKAFAEFVKKLVK